MSALPQGPLEFRARDLLENLQSGAGLSSIPEAAGVYFWRLLITAPEELTDHDAKGWRAHLDRLSSLPQGRVSNVRVSHSVRVETLVLGGQGLGEKRSVLHRLVGVPEGARKVRTFLADMQSVVPALYVGEAGNLRRRIAQHLRGDTDFASEVGRDGGIQWADLALTICQLGGQVDELDPRVEASDATKIRRGLEYLAAELSIANYTKRAG